MNNFDVKDTNWHDFCYIKGENKKGDNRNEYYFRKN